jgi:hypothetical protein
MTTDLERITEIDISKEDAQEIVKALLIKKALKLETVEEYLENNDRKGIVFQENGRITPVYWLDDDTRRWTTGGDVEILAESGDLFLPLGALKCLVGK